MTITRWLLVLVSSVAIARGDRTVRLFASPDGAADATGAIDDPLELRAAIERLRDALEDGHTDLRLDLLEGRYAIDRTIVLDRTFAGSPDHPITIGAAPGAHVVLDGAASIPVEAFAPVTDPTLKERLAPSVADRVLVATVTDDRLHRTLAADVMLNLVIDGTSHLPSVFPNEGYARLHNDPVVPEVCPPGIPPEKRAYGVRAGTHPHREDGRPVGWKGSITEPRGAWARLAEAEDRMAGTWLQWERELALDPRRHTAPGFIEADWLLSSIPFVEADHERRALHLARALSYGWNWRKTKEFRVFGLLCEMDRPGEWHYDPRDRHLFLVPPESMDESSTIRIPIADGAFALDGASHVVLHDLHVTNLASGWAFRIGGHHNLLASSSVRHATASGIQVQGESNRVVACDLVDLERHLSLAGGRRSPDEIVDGHNVVENCHIYQRHVRHQKVNVGISGVGNVFRHNLVHNSIGQAVVVGGNDHLIECNELFNIGYDEGDGGAIYAGGDLTGYGITFRHNFIHHLIGVPGKVGRHGIHLDDLQAGAICEGNIFFKSARAAISMNGGAGHRVVHNVFLEGHHGAENRGSGSRRNQERAMRIFNDPDDPHRGSKEDYLGRAVRIVGEEGWNSPPWSDRFPLMQQVLSDEGEFGRFWPIRCEIIDNIHLGNRFDRFHWDRLAPEAAAKSVVRGDVVVSKSAFADYDAFDFNPGPDAPEALLEADIPFDDIGLVLDEHRRSMPDKQNYRDAVRAFFQEVPSMPGTHDEIDTGALVEEGPVVRRTP